MLPGAPPSNLPARDVKFGAGDGPIPGSWSAGRTVRSLQRRAPKIVSAGADFKLALIRQAATITFRVSVNATATATLRS